MTRRSRKRAMRRLAYLTAVGTQGLFAWGWSTHPAMIGTGVTALGVLTAAIVTHRCASKRRRRRALVNAAVPTALYQWWFADRFCDPYRPRSWYGYTGISNSPELRAAQHAEDSWWWALCDPALYAVTWYPNRFEAEKAERRAIRRYCGIGNTVHNTSYRKQWAERQRLQAIALELKYEADRRRLAGRRPAGARS